METLVQNKSTYQQVLNILEATTTTTTTVETWLQFTSYGVEW